jgi:inner membrane protein
MLLAHAPAGYLLTKVLTRTIFKDMINPRRSDRFYLHVMTAGLFGSILPDFDFIYNIFFDASHSSHHSYITHLPFFWLLLTALSIATGKFSRHKKAAVILTTGCLAALLHLVCDTITAEIYWLFPLVNKSYNLFTVSDVHVWWVENYLSHWTFMIEIGIITVSGVFFLRIRESSGYILFLFRHSVKFRAIVVRLTVFITAISLIYLVGTMRFNVHHRIMNKMVTIKYKVLTAATSL